MGRTSKIIRLERALRYQCAPNFCITNITGGPVSWGEVDFLTVSRAGYLTEYEIKTSVADLKKETKKLRWNGKRHDWFPANLSPLERFYETIKFYWIAVPEDIADKCELILPYQNAGLVSITKQGFRDVRKPAKANPGAKPINSSGWEQLAKLMEIRYWMRWHELNPKPENEF